MKTLKMSVIASAILTSLAGAALLTAPVSAERIRLININGYSVIDHQHLVLNGGARRHYLVTLRHRCPDMRFGTRIGTSFASTETIHSPRFEYVTAGHSDMRCYIDTIEEVDDLDTARALILERAEAEEAEGENDTSES